LAYVHEKGSHFESPGFGRYYFLCHFRGKTKLMDWGHFHLGMVGMHGRGGQAPGWALLWK
jgi:hypothetical protein